MTPLYYWAQRHGISAVALSDLMCMLGVSVPSPTGSGDLQSEESRGSEAAVQQQRVLRATQQGGRLWRNNTGACEDSTGRQIRYGLGNISAAVNKVMKSSDLIGITPVVVTPVMVGQRVGVFTAEEVKAPGWKFRQSDLRAVAQLAFIKLVVSLGGIGRFVTRGDE